MQEIKRLAELKDKKEKSEKKLKKVLTPEQRKAQEEELAASEAKRAKMIEEYKHCITFTDDPLPITKFSYRVNNFIKEATMRIREKEFHLATTAQLIRVRNAIKIDSVEAREMYDKMIYVIDSRDDVVEARKIRAMKELVECKASASNLRRIQVRDIVKEVEDYFKIHASAGMDVS
ncbi:hypothetical protein Tco_0753697 [Tanacetum coccineum]